MRVGGRSTRIEAVSVAALKGVMPPQALASAAAPLAPAVPSQAWKVMPEMSVPCQSVAGTSRIRVFASAASRRASVTLGLPKSDQVAPPSVEYCHVLPSVLSTPTTAIPSAAPASTSVIRSPPALAMISLTVLPGLLTAFCAMGVRRMSAELSSTGASFTAATVTWTWSGVPESSAPSQAVTVKAARVPLASSSGRQIHCSPALSVVPGSTFEPFVVSVPLVRTARRKLIASPSTSSSSAAAASVAQVIGVSVSSGEPDRSPIVVSAGASFTAPTVTLTWTAAAESSSPSEAVTVKAASVPLAFSAGRQIHCSPGLSSVVPGVTAEPFLVSVPLVRAARRKLMASPSASNSSAAAAKAA